MPRYYTEQHETEIDSHDSTAFLILPEPGMKMIEWNGEEYLVKLVNLWVNLVSHDPSDLPRIEIS